MNYYLENAFKVWNQQAEELRQTLKLRNHGLHTAYILSQLRALEFQFLIIAAYKEVEENS